jgi:hypothetical protein
MVDMNLYLCRNTYLEINQYNLFCAGHHSFTRSLTDRAETFLRSRQLCSHTRTSQYFMEPESSLPCSREPSTDPYHEPHQSNLSLRSILISLILHALLCTDTNTSVLSTTYSSSAMPSLEVSRQPILTRENIPLPLPAG